MQRTLNRELKELEDVGREAIATCGERLPDRGLLIFGDTPVVETRGGNFAWVGPPLSQSGNQAGIS